MNVSAGAKRAATSAERSGSWYCGLLLCVLAGSAAGADRLFGIPLSSADRPALLGASRVGAPTPLLLLTPATEPGDSSDAGSPSASWNGADYWFYATPGQIPLALRNATPQLQIALSDSYELFWLRLTAEPDDCAATQRWLESALARKYRTDSWQDSAAETRLLTTDDYRIALRCKDRLQLEYLRPMVHQQVYNSRFERPKTVAEAREQRALEYIQRLRLQQEASAWIRGTASRVDQFLGLDTGHPDPRLADREPDQALPYAAVALALAPPDATHQLTVDPAGAVIRLESLIPDPDNRLVQKVLAELRAVFGEPYRSSPTTQRYRIGNQWIVIRHREGTLRLVYLNKKLQDEQEQRAKEAELARFAEEAQGL